ncbi:MAG: efflux RND transporter permease subunit [Gammaproteobacteria bacterium]|nr:efflux RND transporter permease subunit [Gammaproteobacteria bacterium]
MPKAVARPSAGRRRSIIFLVALTMFLGFFSLERLPIDFLLSLNASRLRVQVAAPGLTAAIVDEKITQVIAAALTDVPEIAAVESISSSGMSTLDVLPRHTRKIEQLQRDIAERLDPTKLRLPPTIGAPSLTRIDDAAMAARLAVTSTQYDPLALRDWAEGELARRLQELPGVATVELKGGDVREIVVLPDQRRLAGLGLGFGDIIQAIQKGRDAGVQVSVMPKKIPRRRELMPLGNVAAVAAMPVVLPSGESLSLAEIAKVTLKEESRSDAPQREDKGVVRINVQKQAGVARAQVAERVQSHIEWMRANRLIPEGIEVQFLSKRSDQARQSLKQIAKRFFSGMALVLVTAYVLLGSRRRVLILGVVTLSSIFSIFILMAVARLSLDAMSLGTLVLMSGFLGIGSLTIFENSREFAARRLSVRSSIIAVAVCLPAAVVPFLFVNPINILFRDFILMSLSLWMLAVAWTLLIAPLFDIRRRNQGAWHAAVSQVLARGRQAYGRLMRVSLRRPRVGLVLLLIFVGAITAIVFLKKPVAMPLPDGQKGAGIILRVNGPDAARLSSIADDLAQRVSATNSLRNIRHSAQTIQDDLSVQMDEARARELGIDVTEVSRDLAIARTGISLGHIRDAEKRYDIRLRLPSSETNGASVLQRILLRGESEDQPAIYLRDVAQLERRVGPAEIRRVNGLPMIELTATATATASPQQVRADVLAALTGYALPQDYFVSSDDAASTGDEPSKNIVALGLGLLLIWLMQIFIQGSWRFAVLLGFTVLITAMGAAAVLLIFNIPLSMPISLGLALLLGIAAIQAISLLAPLEVQRAQLNLSAIKISQTIKYALRPLLVMTLMSVLGMLPLLFMDGVLNVLHPLILTFSLGALFSLLVNLWFTPWLYFFMLGAKEQIAVKTRL